MGLYVALAVGWVAQSASTRQFEGEAWPEWALQPLRIEGQPGGPSTWTPNLGQPCTLSRLEGTVHLIQCLDEKQPDLGLHSIAEDGKSHLCGRVGPAPPRALSSG